jgi:hypothetical protein
MLFGRSMASPCRQAMIQWECPPIGLLDREPDEPAQRTLIGMTVHAQRHERSVGSVAACLVAIDGESGVPQEADLRRCSLVRSQDPCGLAVLGHYEVGIGGGPFRVFQPGLNGLLSGVISVWTLREESPGILYPLA